jgi:hypothetical protein
MTTHVNEFKLETAITDGFPHVRISLKDGTVVMDTDKVSIIGLENLSEVFETAAKMASRQLEQHWRSSAR